MLLFLLSTALLLINTYGLFQDIRPQNIAEEHLRFQGDFALPYQDVMAQLERLPNESAELFSRRATELIAQGLAHIHWEAYEPEKFNQLVPVWENYWLYLMGKLSGIPEYRKYHFADYKRSLRRGIGLCGDASMVLSQVLTLNGISNKIITFPGHVVVAANYAQEQWLLDADFGVVMPYSLDKLAQNSQAAALLYLAAGYTQADYRFAENMARQPFKTWDGVEHFITKKYYFEKIAYWLKWPFPIVLFLLSLLALKRLRI
ncbi:hypothetical protein ACMZOO_11485 [Catenovulum sp. SX2]|uniref:hypothetical protein n=1 Tax=Catenovulum sp. SX2 TaxID=3398614 RepID=UPI003F86213E